MEGVEITNPGVASSWPSAIKSTDNTTFTNPQLVQANVLTPVVYPIVLNNIAPPSLPKHPFVGGKINFYEAANGGSLSGNSRSTNPYYGNSNPFSLVTNYISGKGFVPREEIPNSSENVPVFSEVCVKTERGNAVETPVGGINQASMLNAKTNYMNGIGWCLGESKEMLTDEDGKTRKAWVRLVCGCRECRRHYLPEAARQASAKSVLFGDYPVIFKFV